MRDEARQPHDLLSIVKTDISTGDARPAMISAQRLRAKLATPDHLVGEVGALSKRNLKRIIYALSLILAPTVYNRAWCLHVYIDGPATRSCQTSLVIAKGKRITAIGLGAKERHPIGKPESTQVRVWGFGCEW